MVATFLVSCAINADFPQPFAPTTSTRFVKSILCWIYLFLEVLVDLADLWRAMVKQIRTTVFIGQHIHTFGIYFLVEYKVLEWTSLILENLAQLAVIKHTPTSIS